MWDVHFVALRDDMVSAYPKGDTAAGTQTGRERLGARQPVWEDFYAEVNPSRYMGTCGN